MVYRSLLFTPANRLDRFEKAHGAGPDWVALDLEDGIGESEKNVCRQSLNDLSHAGFQDRAAVTAVRINAAGTPHGVRDLAAMLDWPTWPGMVILPKVNSSEQISDFWSLAQSCGQTPHLLITLETAIGVERAPEILRDAPASAVVGFGSADYMAEVGGDMTAPSLAWARGRILSAASLAGLPAMDGVRLDIKDSDGLIQEAAMVKSMGFAGKIAIHPAQIAPINSVFTPSAAETETARDMLAASDAAGGGAFAFQGKMVEGPVLARARRMLNIEKEG